MIVSRLQFWLAALVVCAAVAAHPRGAPETLGAITWVRVLEPMKHVEWIIEPDISMLDPHCFTTTRYTPRVCIYRDRSACFIITTTPPLELSRLVFDQLYKMCDGFFPEPIQLKSRFSDPKFLPNQAAPSVDPEWQEHQGAQISRMRRARAEGQVASQGPSR